MRMEADDGPARESGECVRILHHPDTPFLQHEIPILPSCCHASNRGSAPRHLSDSGMRVAGRSRMDRMLR